MSGILKNKKQAAVYAAGLLVLLAVMLLLKLPAPAVVIICILYAACVLLNEAVLARMVRMHKPFEPKSSIRNVDYLLIGVMSISVNIYLGGIHSVNLKEVFNSHDAGKYT